MSMILDIADYPEMDTKLALRRKPQRLKVGRRGLSLLEVVLALAILSMSAALLAQIIQTATDNALGSRDTLQANLLCESTLAEISAGGIQMQSSNWVAITDQVALTKPWYYRIDVIPANIPNMLAVTVYIGDESAALSGTRIAARLTKLFIDPALNLDVPADAAATTGTGATGTGI